MMCVQRRCRGQRDYVRNRESVLAGVTRVSQLALYDALRSIAWNQRE